MTLVKKCTDLPEDFVVKLPGIVVKDRMICGGEALVPEAPVSRSPIELPAITAVNDAAGHVKPRLSIELQQFHEDYCELLEHEHATAWEVEECGLDVISIRRLRDRNRRGLLPDLADEKLRPLLAGLPITSNPRKEAA